MHRRTLTSSALAAGLGTVALAALGTTALAEASPRADTSTKAAGPKITIRIEGAKKTLLETTTIHAPTSGSITKDGAPKGGCPAASATGALQVATKGKWSGTWYSSYDDYDITKILGETETGDSGSPYWEIFLNNRATTTGACSTKLRAGDSLLFAAVSQAKSAKDLPLVIKTAKTAKAGASLKVTVDDVDAKGKDVALKGATVTGGAKAAKTNAKGVATVDVKGKKTITLGASDTGYVRAATVKVKVTS